MSFIRPLLRAPLFTAAAVAALGLGIGVNTAIFSALNATLLRPGFMDDPDKVAVIGAAYPKRGVAAASASFGDYLDARAAPHLFSQVVAQNWANVSYAPATKDGASPTPPERLLMAPVSPGWFETFGARPLLGRVFAPAEEQPGHHRVVVLAHGTWQRLFGGDARAIGGTMRLNDEPHEIVGVMPPEFRWPMSADLWRAMPFERAFYESQGRLAGGLAVYARLRPGVTPARAEAELAAMAERAYNSREQAIVRESGRRNRVWSFAGFQVERAQVQPAPLVGAVVFVLLIACANVAGLLLARGAGRSREMAIRSALGASRWQMMKPLLGESLVLAALGVAAGIGFAWVLLRVLILFAPPQDSPERTLRFDGWVLGFTVVVGLASGLLFGLLPAWQTSAPGLGRFQARQRPRSILVVAEVALALVLLVGAGLFLRSIHNLQSVEPGFDLHELVAADLQIPVHRNRAATEPARVAQFHRAVMERLRTTPGVTHAAISSHTPLLAGDERYTFTIPGRDHSGDPFADDGGARVAGMARRITPEYFATLGVTVLAGRAFTDNDVAASEPVIMVDERLARRYFGSPGAAVDQHMLLGSRRLHRIVGVAAPVRQSEPGIEIERPLFYLATYADPIPYAVFLVRGSGDLGQAIRQAVFAVDPSLAVFNAQPLEERLRVHLAPKRMAAWLLGFFAAAALFLAALGLYGVISYSVSQRTQEIGVRVALGARASEVVRLVMGDGLRLALIGTAIGLAGAVGVARAVARQLYRVGPLDPVAFAVTAGLLMGVAVLASWLPARRAARVDPLVALRRE